MLSMSSRSPFALAGLAIAYIGGVAGALPADCARNTTVHLGETCDLIGEFLNVSTYQLEAVNNGTIDANCDNLAEGEPLCLGIIGHDCTQTHVVASGDGCDTISAAAGITEATLFINNPNVNSGCTNIYPGLVLCVADYAVYANSTMA